MFVVFSYLKTRVFRSVNSFSSFMFSFIFESLHLLFTLFTAGSLRSFIDPLPPPSILHQLLSPPVVLSRSGLSLLLPALLFSHRCGLLEVKSAFLSRLIWLVPVLLLAAATPVRARRCAVILPSAQQSSDLNLKLPDRRRNDGWRQKSEESSRLGGVSAAEQGRMLATATVGHASLSWRSSLPEPVTRFLFPF